MASRLFPAGAPDVLYVVDLSGFILRGYHAMRPLTSPGGEPTHATLVTVNMLERLVRERRPAMLAVAMDSGRDTFRREMYPEYKANRPPAPDDLKVQMARCGEIVDAFAIPILRQKGVEADDLIACAVRRAAEHGIKVVIVAADKDLMQLVGDDVLMWDTMRDRVFGPPEVKERFGVEVEQVREVLALMGDSSDNIPGVPSVGPKTARDLVGQYASLEGIYEHLDEIKRKKLKETLAEHRDQAFLSRELVKLKDDCLIDFDLERLRYGGRHTDRLRALYTELGFQRLLSQLEESPVASAEASQGGPEPATSIEARYQIITDAAELERVANEATQRGELAISTVTHAPAVSMTGAVLVGIGLGIEPGRAYYLPLEHRYVGAPKQLGRAEVARVLGPALKSTKVKKLAHHFKHHQVLLARHELELEGLGFDTELAHYLLDPEQRHGLGDLSRELLGESLPSFEDLTKKARGKRIGFDEISVEEALTHVAAEADMTLRLRDILSAKLADASLTKLFREVELPLAGLLAKMELLGVLVDVERLAELGTRCNADLERLEVDAHRIAGRDFNVNSPRQLETLLFDELGLKPIKRTKTARSTDAATLEALSDSHEICQVILDIRQLAKLKGTYIDALPSLVNPKTGRIHTSWEQAVAATGRLSSTDPNLQNIPIRTELGRQIRSAFVAPPGHQLVSADYSQIELRVLAHLSGDPVLLEAFRTGQDIHTRTAMEIFEVAEDEVTREMRTKSKAVNFGVIYGQGDSGLSKALGISRAEAGEFIAAYFRRYEGVRRFMNETLDNARAGESVRSLLGRHRMLPDIKSGNRGRRLAAERIAMNMPIQGTAADLLKLAMLALREPVTEGTRMIMTVHDELVFEVPDAELQTAMREIRKAMESVYPLDVPLVVDVGSGPDWNSAH